MDLKSILVKFVGAFVFSYGLIGAIGDFGIRLYNDLIVCARYDPTNSAGCVVEITAFNPLWHTASLFVMAVGLVLLAYEFFPTQSKAKK